VCIVPAISVAEKISICDFSRRDNQHQRLQSPKKNQAITPPSYPSLSYFYVVIYFFYFRRLKSPVLHPHIMKTLYRNRLPHIAPLGATFFVSFNQYDSLPAHVAAELKMQLELALAKIEKDNPPDKEDLIVKAKKRFFSQRAHLIDGALYGSCHLKKPDVAQILKDKIMEYDGRLIEVEAMCIMPNHVHLLFSMELQLENAGDIGEEAQGYVQLDKVMQLIKGGSSYLINKHLGLKDRFWAKDSYDHYIRNEAEWYRVVRYILLNPVKAGLVKRWEDWPFTMISESALHKYRRLQPPA